MSARSALGILAGACFLAFSPATGSASVIQKLDEKALSAGADAVVEGTVLGVTSMWNGDHSGLITRIEVSVERVLAGQLADQSASQDSGQVGRRIAIVQPGGTLDGNRHIIPGMPHFRAGERVRLYVQELSGAASGLLDGLGPDPLARYRVYGWAQGKWVEQPSHSRHSSAASFAPDLPAGTRARTTETGEVLSFTHNGMVWPDNKIPVEYLIGQDGSDDLSMEDAQAAISAAFATWDAVPCSRLSYAHTGMTDLQVAVDGQNVILWIESGWIYGAEAGAAASLWIPIEEERTADVAFNGENFSWAIAPEAAISFTTLDVQSVLTHELGHFSGLGHTQSSVDTMYIAWRPWPGQRTLSADDKLGLCELYPQTADECAESSECPGSGTCERYAHGTLCTSPADAIGAMCNYERIECAHFCLFTSADLSDGYCSRFCEQPGDCPGGFACQDASLGEMPVQVCFVEPVAPGPDAGPGPDASSGACTIDGDCPSTQHCGADQQCAYECLEPIDCPSGTVCGARGHCVPADGDGGGCGCRTAAMSGGPGGPGLWLLAVFALWISARRRR